MNEKIANAASTTQGSEAMPEPALGSASVVTTPLRQGPETTGERLKRLYPSHYVRILELMNKDHGSDAAARMLSRTATGCELSRAFLWGNTHEGYQFWKALMEQSNG